MLQHCTGRPTSSWARCCPRLHHINDSNGQMPFHTFLGLSHALAPGFVMKLGHSDVTSVHRIIPCDVVHRPCAIALPTSPSVRLAKSSHANHPHRSSRRVGTTQHAFLATRHAIARSNPHAESDKCESLFARCAHKQRGQHELHAHSSAIGNTSSVAGKLFQLRNHNDTRGRTVQVLPREAQFHWADETSKNYN